MIKIKQCDMIALSTEDLKDDVVISNCHQVVICPQASDYVSNGYDETQPFGDLIRKISPPRFLELLNTNEEDINKNPFKIASDRIISEIQKEYPNVTETNIKSIVLFEFIRLAQVMSGKNNFEVISDRFEINESDSLNEKLYKIFSDVFPFVELKDDILTSVNNLQEAYCRTIERDNVDQGINMIVDCLSKEYPSVFKYTIIDIVYDACIHIEKEIARCHGTDIQNVPDPIDRFLFEAANDVFDKAVVVFESLYPLMPFYTQAKLGEQLKTILDTKVEKIKKKVK